MRSFVWVAVLLVALVASGVESRVHEESSIFLDKKVVDLVEVDVRGPASASLLSDSPKLENNGDGGTTEHKSWFSKLKDSMWSVVIGIVLIIFSVLVLWVGEKRSAQMESLITLASRECHSVSGDAADPNNRGTLVHLSGKDARGMADIHDARFSEEVACKSGVIRIRSKVEVYQWIEESEKKEEKDRVGGGTTTTTTYKYKQEWRATRIDSSSFNQRAGHENAFPVDGLALGTKDVTCARVEYGQGFLLSAGMAEQLTDFQCASTAGNPFKLGDSVHFNGKEFHKEGGYYVFSKEGNLYHHHDHDEESTRGAHVVGDTRVQFEYVPDGPATIMALQARSEEQDRDGFLPYRLVSRGICGLSQDELKRRLIARGELPKDEAAQEEQCHLGPLDCVFCCCLCACNIVYAIVFHIGLPEIYYVFSGRKSTKECLDDITNGNKCATMCLRILGWLMMLFGLYSLFEPIFVVIDIVPYLGPWLSDKIALVTGFFSALVTLIISLVIVGFAYLIYHPKKALIYLVLPALLIAGVVVLCEYLHESS